MTKTQEKVIDDCCQQLKSQHGVMRSAAPVGNHMEAGIWDSIIAIILPLFLQWFQNCNKGPASKKADQINDEMQRIALVRRGRRQDRKLHKRAEKLMNKPEVVEANGGQELTDDQKDELYEEMVQYAFENRDAVAKAAATRG